MADHYIAVARYQSTFFNRIVNIGEVIWAPPAEVKIHGPHLRPYKPPVKRKAFEWPSERDIERSRKDVLAALYQKVAEVDAPEDWLKAQFVEALINLRREAVGE